MFKKRRGIKLPYNRQGLIYFVCMNIVDMPEEIQKKILNLSIEVGKDDYQALYEFLTNDRSSAVSVSLKYLINEKRLYRLRKEFYERF